MATTFAHLKSDSPLYPIFERGMVPIKTIVPAVALLGDEEQEAFMLDWSKCTPRQQAQIAALVHCLRGGQPSNFLEHMADGGDMFIRVSQTFGTSTNKPFYL